MLKILLQEPLFQFLLLGALLYGYYSFTNESTMLQTQSIKITQEEILKIKSEYQNEYNKELSSELLDAYIKLKYQEEILLNEAYTLGLQKEDESISKKMITQMNFILLNSTPLQEPSEQELEDYYKQNIADYSKLEKLSFTQVYLSHVNEKKAQKLFELFSKTEINLNAVSSFSDSINLQTTLNDIGYNDIKKLYGKFFAKRLFSLKQGVWYKDIHSKYGKHLVYISEKKVGDAYPFDEVQGRVYRDYLRENKESAYNAAYEKIQTQYTLELLE